MSEQTNDFSELTSKLRNWAEKKEIQPAEFARRMGYTYNHAFQVLRGRAKANSDTLGRVAMAYGAEAVAEIMAGSVSDQGNQKDTQ